MRDRTQECHKSRDRMMRQHRVVSVRHMRNAVPRERRAKHGDIGIAPHQDRDLMRRRAFRYVLRDSLGDICVLCIFIRCADTSDVLFLVRRLRDKRYAGHFGMTFCRSDERMRRIEDTLCRAIVVGEGNERRVFILSFE